MSSSAGQKGRRAESSGGIQDTEPRQAAPAIRFRKRAGAIDEQQRWPRKPACGK
ncbi:hypothetical protein [Bacillus sp. FSL M8-0168]|uniref:hypothetical protein n=1 Tax=Bacillus sp. FSL M8-0168 TaxID=2921614 RepID=UPI0030FD5A57